MNHLSRWCKLLWKLARKLSKRINQRKSAIELAKEKKLKCGENEEEQENRYKNVRKTRKKKKK